MSGDGTDDASRHQPRDETAVWGTGTDNGLVVILKAIFTWQLEDGRTAARNTR